MSVQIREMRLPDDYAGVAALLNLFFSEPVTAERLEEDDAKLYEKGHTYLDDNGLLAGYDRIRLVAQDEDGTLAGYIWSWRAPWTERGHLNNTLVVGEAYRGRGIGSSLLRQAAEWGAGLGASRMVAEIWDDSEAARRFAEGLGFAVEEHAYQSVLELEADDEASPFAADMAELERRGVRFATLAEEGDEAGGEAERKLYELYKGTLKDIPGYTGEVPDLHEWRKWHLKVEGYHPEQVIIAVIGDVYAGVSNVVFNKQTGGMNHEYTGVSRDYRGRGIAFGLKVRAIAMAKSRGAAYLKTDNNSANEPILRINRRLGYVPLRGSYRVSARLADVLDAVHRG